MPTLGPSTLDHPLANGIPPNWAAAWGDDDFGPWVEIHVGDAKQSLRWIPPGTFLMGSLEIPPEWEGYSETPQQTTTISRGFWLFDTPCTQALWEVVMGENPSRFKGPSRPVENVSWHDCQQFVEALNSQLPDLQLALPTEAEWEYACRAGTDTSTYAGDLTIDKNGHADGLEQVAWYTANSENETHDVAELQPNEWGLYDTLGNVWEWCSDNVGRQYTSDAVSNPICVTDDTSALRVIRGGGWGLSALLVRAAYRFGLHPDVRDDSLGFRCSSSGEPGGQGGGPERSGRSRRGAGGDSAVKSDESRVVIRLSLRKSVVCLSFSKGPASTSRQIARACPSRNYRLAMSSGNPARHWTEDG
ncbi:MAG: sulfatase activating formylglycine-generating enzyme [Planctomycetaceae bacterium]|jgi:formylglycine-generating enzyme required for sulfatase activity